MSDDKLARIIDARMKLKERWREKSEASPGRADAKPMGSGPANRHGMPQVPPGQHVSKNWPVLDLGFKPEISTAAWKLTLDGAVEQSVTLDWAAFNAH